MLSPQADSRGQRLGLDDYSEDFSRHFWRSGSEGFWKLERQQSFQEPGVESLEAPTLGPVHPAPRFRWPIP